MPRIPRTPLLIATGLLSAGLLGMTGTGTLSSISAQVITRPDTATLGRMVLQLASAGGTCRSDSGSSNVFVCETVQPLSGRKDLLPGDAVTVDVTASNEGTVLPRTFTLTTGRCQPTGTATEDNARAVESVCDDFTVELLVGGTSVFKGGASELAEQNVPLPVPAARGGSVAVRFITSTPEELGNEYQGLGISMPMTWTFQQ